MTENCPRAVTPYLCLLSSQLKAVQPNVSSPTPKHKTSLFFSVGLAALLIAAPAMASQRRICELEARQSTTIARGGGLGGLAGGGMGALVAPTACVGFLAFIIIDFGVSFASCLAAVTTTGAALGTIGGISISENALIEAMKKCAELPDY